jgi:nucleoside-diphosphate-sugar epimerase
MRLLVLGGTAFLGRAVARHAVAAGHDVTCAARGGSGGWPAGVRTVRVDRDDPAGLAPLAGEEFDALVDVARRPSHTRRAAAAFGDRVGHAVYVSTVSVYADDATPGQRAADAPLLDPAPPEVDDPAADPAAYGPCKVACELAYLGGFGAERTFVCRAGLIVGPQDETQRFTYWVQRLARGGEVLAPGAPDDAVQVIDVRDLAAWLVDGAARRLAGTYDGISAPMPRAELLARVAAGVGVSPELTWVPQEFLADHDVRPWAGPRSLPLWLPLPGYAGFLARDVSASLAAGLTIRDVADTARDTLAWVRDTGPPAAGQAGIDAEVEAAVLRAWHGRQDRRVARAFR